MEFWATKPNLAQSRHTAHRCPVLFRQLVRGQPWANSFKTFLFSNNNNKFKKFENSFDSKKKKKKKDQIASVSEGSDKMTGLLEEVRKCFKRLTVL